MAFASGKNAYFHCLRCGFRYPYGEMRAEQKSPFQGKAVTGYCPECVDPVHPQLRIRGRRADAEALRDARPGSDVDNQNQGTPVVPWTLSKSRPPGTQ